MKTLLLTVLALTLSAGNMHAFAPQPPVVTTNECGEVEITYPALEGSKAPRYTKPSPPTVMEWYDKLCWEAYESPIYWVSIGVACFALASYVYVHRRRKCSLKI